MQSLIHCTLQTDICIGPSNAFPYFTGTCTSAPCPANSIGLDISSGCVCTAGYSGTIRPSNSSPFYRVTCTSVPCPPNSTGTDVVIGCVCNVGYIGAIYPAFPEQRYKGSCAAVACPANSLGVTLPVVVLAMLVIQGPSRHQLFFHTLRATVCCWAVLQILSEALFCLVAPVIQATETALI